MVKRVNIRIPEFPVFKTAQGKFVRPTNIYVAQARLAHLREVRNRLFGKPVRIKTPKPFIKPLKV